MTEKIRIKNEKKNSIRKNEQSHKNEEDMNWQFTEKEIQMPEIMFRKMFHHI